jgi:hypothetical protein
MAPTLRTVLNKERMSVWQAVETARCIALAAGHAHSRGVVHRDIKPANILFDSLNRPLLSDFGLAWKQTLRNVDTSVCGTPRYMSPEQIRGELHRIDARSDIFSLGIVLYEMLTDHLPFDGDDNRTIADATVNHEPIAVRSLNDAVPIELDRICRRAMRKSVRERYPSMLEFAKALEDLQHNQVTESGNKTRDVPNLRASLDSRLLDSTAMQPELLVPRGLQPFRRVDGDGFLELLPGPRHPCGLPESVYFWKTWIESSDAGELQRLAILYGAAGSGKSSLIEAGVIANLNSDILAISIECQPGDLQARITQAIGNQIGSPYPIRELTELLQRLRLEETITHQHRKIVLFLDQFEEWARFASPAEFQELAAALRQCDGEHLQAIIVVRDEQWSKVSRLMELAEVPMAEGKNSRGMDLIGRNRARKILESMGRYYGTLPAAHESLDVQHRHFLDLAVSELGSGHGGRVLPIQLTIFAQMAELHHWDPGLLSDLDSLEGLYVAFFEDHFESESASAQHRHALPVAAEFLAQLLPGPDQSIVQKTVSITEVHDALGGRFSASQILAAANILCEELRTVIQVDAGTSEASTSELVDDPHQAPVRYRIAHDFMVKPIRQWVEQVNYSSRRGRAIARFHELSGMWKRRRERRFFPSVTEYFQIKRASRKLQLTPHQREYLTAADRYYRRCFGVTIAAGAVLCCLLVVMVSQWQRIARDEAKAIDMQFDHLIHGKVQDVPASIQALSESSSRMAFVNRARSFVDSIEPAAKTRCRLFLADTNPRDLSLVYSKLPEFPPELLDYIIDLSKTSEDCLEELDRQFKMPDASSKTRAAIVEAYRGDTSKIESLLSLDSDDDQRQLALQEATLWRAGPELWSHLLATGSADVRYHAAIILGSYPPGELQGEMEFLRPHLRQMLEDDSAMLHETADWLYRTAGLEPPTYDRSSASENPNADWMRASSGLELVKLRVKPLPAMFQPEEGEGRLNNLEAPADDDWYEVWMTSAAITHAEVHKYLQTNQPVYVSDSLADEEVPLDDRPALRLDVVDAALICNAYSQRDRLPVVYRIERDEQGVTYIAETRWEAGGYRLPTSQEMLCALIANQSTIRSSQTAQLVFERSGRSFETDTRANTRSVKSLFPSPYGHFIHEHYKSWLCHSAGSFTRMLPGKKGFLGFEADEREVHNWQVFLVRSSAGSTPLGTHVTASHPPEQS